MLFNTYEFWIFLGVVVTIYFRLRHSNQNNLLLLSSYFFYGCWDWRFLGLVAASTLVDFFASQKIHRESSLHLKRLYLFASIAVNLGALGVFKYCNFFIDQLTLLLSFLGFDVHVATLSVILPVGISFYTFQTLSYTIDVYRGRISPATSLRDFALYVCFFPQLVAGPIERFGQLMPQISNQRQWRPEFFREGNYHVILGLFKKVVIADNFAPIVEAVFNTPPEALTGAEIAVGVFAFSMQIYGDFSGYSSIAQGIACYMGFKLSYNFRMPYFATSPSDFWQRWHITLSQWLRDYLYIPLGGNRGGWVLTCRNLMLTMMIGGLWHGAGWCFIIWGAYHGAILCIYRVAGSIPYVGHWIQTSSGHTQGTLKFVSMLVMFLLTMIGWLIFRSESLSQLFTLLVKLCQPWGSSRITLYALSLVLVLSLPLIVYEFYLHHKGDCMLLILDRAPLFRTVLYGYCLTTIVLFRADSHNQFIYFQF